MNSQRRYLYLALVLVFAGILSACDPIGYPYLAVNRVVIFNNTPYLLVLEKCSWGIGCTSQENNHYFTSNDYGKTWQELSALPFEVPPAIETAEQMQAMVCAPNDANTCYRISGKEQVDVSKDGGNTWQIEWQQPAGRITYVERNPYITRLLEVKPDTIPYSIGIMQNSGKSIVIVAMGNQGVLVKSQDGTWERYAISSTKEVPVYEDHPYSAVPLPYHASSITEIKQSLGAEISRSLLIAVIFLITLSIYRRRHVRSNMESTPPIGNKRPLILSIGVMLLLIVQFSGILVFPVLSRPDNFSSVFISVISTPFVSSCLVTIIGLLISWELIASIPQIHDMGANGFLTDIGYSLLLLLGILLPFVLWSTGIIPRYGTAVIISLVLGIIVVTFSFISKKLIPITAT
jgi:hypothetical protein